MYFLKVKNTKTDLENLIKSFESIMDQADGEKIYKSEGRSFEIIQSEEKKKKKRMKMNGESLQNLRIILKELNYASLGSQKRARKKEQKAYLNNN